MSSSSHSHHIVPTRTYLATLAALGVLMALTVWVAQFNLPAMGPLSGTVVNQTVALIIACVKATLVVSIFMGVKYQTQLTKMWAIVGFVWFFLMFIMFGDYGMRSHEHVPSWETQEAAGLPRTPSKETGPIEDLNQLNVHPRQ